MSLSLGTVKTALKNHSDFLRGLLFAVGVLQGETVVQLTQLRQPRTCILVPFPCCLETSSFYRVKLAGRTV